MQESTSREKILKRIRDALVNPMKAPADSEDYANQIYAPASSEYIEVAFAEALSRVNGQFVYCADKKELAENLKKVLNIKEIQYCYCFEPEIQEILKSQGIFFFNSDDGSYQCEASITQCEFLIARLGSVMVSSRQSWGRKGYIYPPLHIVVARKHQLVYDLKQAFEGLRIKYQRELPSMISLITGPSRTADIEKTLVMGAHGPEELMVFFVDESNS